MSPPPDLGQYFTAALLYNKWQLLKFSHQGVGGKKSRPDHNVGQPTGVSWLTEQRSSTLMLYTSQYWSASHWPPQHSSNTDPLHKGTSKKKGDCQENRKFKAIKLNASWKERQKSTLPPGWVKYGRSQVEIPSLVWFIKQRIPANCIVLCSWWCWLSAALVKRSLISFIFPVCFLSFAQQHWWWDLVPFKSFWTSCLLV